MMKFFRQFVSKMTRNRRGEVFNDATPPPRIVGTMDLSFSTWRIRYSWSTDEELKSFLAYLLLGLEEMSLDDRLSSLSKIRLTMEEEALLEKLEEDKDGTACIPVSQRSKGEKRC